VRLRRKACSPDRRRDLPVNNEGSRARFAIELICRHVVFGTSAIDFLVAGEPYRQPGVIFQFRLIMAVLATATSR
jgi:hypothetical protein